MTTTMILIVQMGSCSTLNEHPTEADCYDDDDDHNNDHDKKLDDDDGGPQMRGNTLWIRWR